MVVSQIQVAHSGGEEDDRLTPRVAQVQQTPSDVEEVIGLQPVVAHQNISHAVEEGADVQSVIALVQGGTFGAEEAAGPQPVATRVQRITSGVEEGTDLQSVGVERRAAYEVADHMNTLGRRGTEIELPGLDRLMSQRHRVSTLPATTCMSQAHASKYANCTNQPLMFEDADDDEYLSAKSDAGEDFVSLFFS